ncbi:hypothetical protein [Pseudomonas putida]
MDNYHFTPSLQIRTDTGLLKYTVQVIEGEGMQAPGAAPDASGLPAKDSG